jgi:hypothetical protein
VVMSEGTTGGAEGAEARVLGDRTLTEMTQI